MYKLSVHKFLYNCAAGLLVLAFALGVLGLPGARAASLTVSNTNDSGSGSLRQAILDANASSGADTITFSVSGTITLGSTLPAISDAAGLTIDGAEQTITISGGNTVKVMVVNSGAALTVKNLTIANGSAPNSGGGIVNVGGTLTVENSTFSGNRAITGNSGGGLYNYTGGTLNVTDSTFSGNSAALGAGIFNFSGGTLNVTDSTFSGNSATHNGGGIYNFSGGTLTVTNSTFSGNSATISGGGIYNGGTSTLRNTIVANNPAGGNCGGSITDGGGNLVWGDTTCPGINADPKLLALANNGGPTETMALDTGSAAIDAAVDANCPAADQRGVSRPQGAGCDIGAFELEAAQDTTPPTITITTPSEGAIYLLGQSVNADYACQDENGGSGLAFCIGTVANGSPIDTSSIGPKSFTVNAADNAGNPALLTHNYSVVYNFSGFFQPVDNLPTLNMVKGGAGVAVRFSLGGDQGLNILAAGYPISQQVVCEGGLPVDEIEQTVAAGNSSLSYDAATDTYSYTWKTNKAWTGSCRQLILKLSDGTEHKANFKFK